MARRRTRLQEFGTDELKRLLRERPAIPVLQDGQPVRFSLAGSAGKWAIVHEGGRLYWPLGSAPSTHILKVYDPRFSHGPFNEAFTGYLAGRLGLSVASAVPTDDYLLITRYDRGYKGGRIVRLHQEDGAQALGIPPFRKYQREGGIGLAQLIETVREHSSQPLQDQRSLVTWQLANLLLGNSDGHLKNVSFLLEGGTARLAPFYDMVCTRNYDGIERSLALSIGENSDPGHIGREHFGQWAREIGMRESLILDELDRIIRVLSENLDDYAHEFAVRWGSNPVIARIAGIVRTQIRRTKTLLA